MKVILRPLMPPSSLTFLKYASIVLPMTPYADAGPEYGFVFPILISVSDAPSSYFPAADAVPASAKPTANTLPASILREICNMQFSSCCGSSNNPSSGVPRLDRLAAIQQAQQPGNPAGDPGRHQIDQGDQHDAVDGPRLNFDRQVDGGGDVARKRVGVLFDHLHEYAAEHSAGEGCDAANHHADQQRDRELQAEAVGSNALSDEGINGAGNPGVERADAESDGLVVRQVDTDRAGSHRLIADRHQRTTRPAGEEMAGDPEHQGRNREHQPEHPLVGSKRQIEWGPHPPQVYALYAASQILDVLELQDLWDGDGEREGGKRKIGAFQPECGKAEQIADRKAEHRRGRERGPVGPSEARHQHGCDIRADGHESAVP